MTQDAYTFLNEAIEAWGVIGWPTCTKYYVYHTALVAGGKIIATDVTEEEAKDLLEIDWPNFELSTNWTFPPDFIKVQSTCLGVDPKYKGQDPLPLIKEIFGEMKNVPDWVVRQFPDSFKTVDVEVTLLSAESVFRDE